MAVIRVNDEIWELIQTKGKHGESKSDVLMRLISTDKSDGTGGDQDPYSEINLVIKSFVGGYNIPAGWKIDLHPADVLDKYVFPAVIGMLEDKAVGDGARWITLKQKLKEMGDRTTNVESILEMMEELE